MKTCPDTRTAKNETTTIATVDSHGHHFNKSVGKISRSALIDSSVVRRLSKRQPSALVSRLALDYAIMVAAIVICEFYWHPLLYVLAIMTIGARQAGIGSVALHPGKLNRRCVCKPDSGDPPVLQCQEHTELCH